MTTQPNATVVLRRRATGLPTPDLFEVVAGDVPQPAEGEVLVRNVYVTADPGMKGWISNARNYLSVETGTTMQASGVGEVVWSRNPDVPEGAYVVGQTGWQEYGVASPQQPIFRVVDPSEVPLSTSLGALGLSGLTAYFGLLDLGRPQSGETVLVSTAAGSVGSAAGQIAQIHGCRTVGITGGPEKVALCRDVFGFDAAIDYKSTPDLGAAIAQAAPKGVDVYFDNVGGDTLDTVAAALNPGARIVVCGTAATPSWDPPPTGVRLERYILVNRLHIQGFVVFDFKERYPEAFADLDAWVRGGQLRFREDISDGLSQAPHVLAGLYSGANTGRALIRVRPDPTL